LYRLGYLPKFQGKVQTEARGGDPWKGGSGATTTSTTILQAIQNVVGLIGIVECAGDRPGTRQVGDLGIVMVGELPYAEGQGNDQILVIDAIDAAAVPDVWSNMPCVVVLISGRPMIINAQLAQANPFAAVWLPGTEGKGMTGVLFGSKNFVGKLPMSWLSRMDQIPIDVGNTNYVSL
jgi:beta-glucosidase